MFPLTLSGNPAASARATAEAWVHEQAGRITAISDAVWEHAELAFQEHRSSKLLADTLEEAGFTVCRGVADMKTAFVAEFGEGKPVVAFLAEFDALPALSQKAQPAREPLIRGKPGHGCGHNLLGAASVAAGIAVKEALVKHNLPGKIVVFGTPAEEGGAGKVYMVRAGLFKDVDAVIAWHPGQTTRVHAGSCLAVKRGRFRFHGAAAHASGSPEKGRSALDAVELMNIGANFLREHITSETRIHYVITNGGGRPNVVPEEAEVWYYARAPRMAEAQATFQRIQEVAQGACLMTRTRFELREESGTYETLPNQELARLVDAHLKRVGAPRFDEADSRFATELRRNVGLDAGAALDEAVHDISFQRVMGSTDVGDVSWTVPTIEFGVTARASGTAAHAWPFVACAGSPIGHKACLTAAKVMAASAIELIQQSGRLRPIRAEFELRTKGFSYHCGIPAGAKPPERIDSEN
jgi:aminobenzoyl-glutamate utilization protein B